MAADGPDGWRSARGERVPDLRVFLVGGILLLYPRISRRGLVFGTYVGEVLAESDAVRDLLAFWTRGCLVLMALSLVVGLGISAAGQPVTGNLTGTAVLLLSAPFLYLATYLRARAPAPRVAARQAELAAAPLEVDERGGDRFAKLALAVCVLTALGTVVHALVRYESLPQRIPTVFQLIGLTDEPSTRSLAAVLYVPS